MKENRKTAKKLLLVNWSCFQNECIELGSSTLFTGVNGTGKTTILDAMSYLLTANTQFNKAADDKDRTVQAYIHGDRKTNGSDRYLRKGAVTGYIAMEFYSPIDTEYFVTAVCIESRSEQDRAESKWFCCHSAKLEDVNFCVIEDGKQLTTARNNLHIKGISFKSSDFMGRDKAIPQITRVLGIRGDYKKYKEKLLKMMAFDPERNVDKFLQDSVLVNVEVNSLQQLREQKNLYEKAKQMFENIKQGKLRLEGIEEKTAEYEKQLQAKNIRELMYEYQYLNKEKIDIEEIKHTLKNFELEKQDLKRKNLVVEKEFEKTRKRLAAVENENHTVMDTKRNLEITRNAIADKIRQLESDLAQLKQLQSALSALSGILKSHIDISPEQKTVLEHMAEVDFSAIEKRAAFLDFSQKVLRQKELLFADQIREEDRLRKLDSDITEIEKNIKKLESNVVIFPREAEEAKRSIKAEFEKRSIKSEVRLFAELVESLTDEGWRKAIETFLGRKRYYILVDDEYCRSALEILREKRLHTANIVLFDRIPETKVEPQSASELLVIKNKAARKYANYLLNGIHLCRTLEELHENPKGALMQDGMLAKSYSASLMKTQETKPCLGNNVVKYQLKQAKQERESLLQDKSRCNEKIENYRHLKKLIENIQWDAENYHFDSAQELHSEKKKFAEKERHIMELTNSPEMLAAMKEIEIARNDFDQAKKQNDTVIAQQTKNETETRHAQKKTDDLTSSIIQRQKNYDELLKKYSELEAEMLAEYERQSKQRNTLIPISEKHLKQLAADVSNAKTRMEDAQLEYNKVAEIDTNNRGVEFIPFYREQYRNVANVKIDEAKTKLEEQSEKLRDVFLHDFVAELNENIISARVDIDAINTELKKIPFGRDVYQFKMMSKTDRKIFFDICTNLEQYSDTPDLFTQRTASTEKMDADVQDFLNKILDSEDESDYSDYRNYFTYDMTIKSMIGTEETEMYLSKKQGSASGGEKQTPYFIVLAASLLQFYPKDTCCARIAFIDEAFSALSKERIEQMVKFLEDNSFQVFYAAPPEKIDSIGSYIDNTISLFTQGKFTKPVEGFRKN